MLGDGQTSCDYGPSLRSEMRLPGEEARVLRRDSYPPGPEGEVPQAARSETKLTFFD